MALKDQKPTEVLDVLGRVCPYPQVLTKKSLEKLPSGAILKIVTDSVASAEDAIPKLAQKYGYEYEVVKLEDKGQWEVYIQKK